MLSCVKLGPTTDESSYYVIGNYKSDSLSAGNDINASLHDIKQQLLSQRTSYIFDPNPKSPKDMKNLFINGSKNFIDKLTPTKDTSRDGHHDSSNGNGTVKIKPMLMTRKELNDPFGSDEEEEIEKTDLKNKSPAKEVMSPPAIDVATANVRTDA